MAKTKLAWLGAAVFGGGGIALLLATSPIPGGLTPPAGPVKDTTPSLAELESRINQVAANSSPFPPNLRVAYANFGGNQTAAARELVPTTEGTTVRVYAIIVSNAGTNMFVGTPPRQIFSGSGSAVLSSGQTVGSNHFAFGGLSVATPVRFETGGQDSAVQVTVLYWTE